MLSICLRKRGKGWEYRFNVTLADGQRKFFSRAGFRTKKEAEKAGEAALEQYKGNGFNSLKSIDMSLCEYLDFWMNNYCRINLKDSTCAGYSKRIENIINPALGMYELQQLTPMVLQNFINTKFNEGFSRNSLSCFKGILSGSLSYAVSSAGLLQSNPMTAVRMPNWRAKPKTPERKKIRQPITAQQWESIMERFPREHPGHIYLNLGYHLGLRLGEAFGLLWDDIDFETGTVSVRRQVQWDSDNKCWCFTEPKYDSSRTLVADATLLTLLKDEYQRQQRAKAYYGERYQQVYLNDQQQFSDCGEPISLVNVRENGSYIQPRSTMHTNRVAHTQLGLPYFDFHTLRHTHATMLLEAGANPLDIQERLGHTKLEMTWRYAHNTDAIRERTKEILINIYQ